MNEPRLTAIMLVGQSRANAQRTLDHLHAQTAASDMEIVVVDLSDPATPALRSGPVPVTYLRQPGVRTWSVARTFGIRAARGHIVAFIEDHCRPAPDWAAHVIAAHREDWAAVGYAFTNGSPDSYFSRAALVADYGPWMHPATPGPAKLIPGNNVAYKREVLLSFGDRLESLMAVDFNLHEILTRQGRTMAVEPKALAAHQSFPHLGALLHANHVYARMMAATRARNLGWSRPFRWFCAFAAPWAVPLLRLARLVRSVAPRRALWRAGIASLPVTTAVYFAAASGEALGYLRGLGNSPEEFLQWELNEHRV